MRFNRVVGLWIVSSLVTALIAESYHGDSKNEEKRVSVLIERLGYRTIPVAERIAWAKELASYHHSQLGMKELLAQLAFPETAMQKACAILLVLGYPRQRVGPELEKLLLKGKSQGQRRYAAMALAYGKFSHEGILKKLVRKTVGQTPRFWGDLTTMGEFIAAVRKRGYPKFGALVIPMLGRQLFSPVFNTAYYSLSALLTIGCRTGEGREVVANFLALGARRNWAGFHCGAWDSLVKKARSIITNDTTEFDMVQRRVGGQPPGIYLGLPAQMQQYHDWRGVDDLSAVFQLLWDEAGLILQIRVNDDLHFQPFRGGHLWQGDSVQFAITSSAVLEQNTPYLEYDVADHDGEEVFRRKDFSEEPLPTTARVMVSRESTNRYYEVTISWQEIGIVPVPGTIFGFSLLVNDNDGMGRRGWFEWGGGIGWMKDPREFRKMKLEG